MSHFIICSVPAHGHVNPTLPLIRELVSAGHSVTAVNAEAFRSIYMAAGATGYLSIESLLGREIFEVINGDFALMYCMLVQSNIHMFSSFLKHEEIIAADCILHDSICSYAKYAAYKLGKPAVCLSTTFAVEGSPSFRSMEVVRTIMVSMLRHCIPVMTARVKQILFFKQHRLPVYSMQDIFTATETHNIVFSSRMVQPDEKMFSEDHYHFVGSIEREEVAVPEFAQLPGDLIYISLGTIHNLRSDFFDYCVQELGDLHRHVLISLGGGLKVRDLGSFPPHIHVYDFVPQLQILKKSSLFVTHAGSNSLHEALSCGVPMLCIPQQIEQVVNARRIVEMGAGELLRPSELTRGKLKSMVYMMSASPSYTANAQTAGESLRTAGGVTKAREIIEQILKPKHLEPSLQSHQ